MKRIYLDNNATSPVIAEVREAMLPFLSEKFANPSSIHSDGTFVRREMEKAREQVAALIGADPSEIIFTSGGTESNNAALFAALENFPEKLHLVSTAVEHPSIKGFLEYTERKGYRVLRLSVNLQGALDLSEFENALREDTVVASVMFANNETGVLFPVAALAEEAKKKKVLFHTDAVQAVGKIPIDVKKLAVDFLSFSGHKLHAPKGVGVLYVRHNVDFQPSLIGGHQENGRRAGTENVPAIIGLGKACEIAKKQMETHMVKIRELRDFLEEGILKNCPTASVNGDRQNRIPNTTNIGFRDLEGESLLLCLDEAGISVSTGSACSSGMREPSRILKAMGIPLPVIHGSLRFSLSFENTKQEIEFVIQEVTRIVQQMRR